MRIVSHTHVLPSSHDHQSLPTGPIPQTCPFSRPPGSGLLLLPLQAAGHTTLHSIYALHVGGETNCPSFQHVAYPRHNAIRNSIARAIRSIGYGTRVTVEPTIPGTSARNDIRVESCPDVAPVDYELKVHSLFAFANNIEEDPPEVTLTTLERRAIKGKPAPPPGSRAPPIVPIVLSVGGLIAPASRNALFAWRRHLRPTTWEHLIRQIGLILLRSRTANFSL